jgi:hypothetical protein
MMRVPVSLHPCQQFLFFAFFFFDNSYSYSNWGEMIVIQLKWTNDLNKSFSKEQTQVTNKSMKNVQYH